MSFVGKFERVSHENYEEFLTAVDVNDVWKKAALSSTPIMEVNMIRLNYKHIIHNSQQFTIIISFTTATHKQWLTY